MAATEPSPSKRSRRKPIGLVTRGTTYRVTCGTTSDTGEFGVIEVPFTAQVISIATGIIGVLRS